MCASPSQTTHAQSRSLLSLLPRRTQFNLEVIQEQQQQQKQQGFQPLPSAPYDMYILEGGSVPVPRWILGFRFVQLIFAIIVIGLTGYSLSDNHGGLIQPGLIAVLIIAILTILPILMLTAPLHLIQRRIYDPRIALCMDGVAILFWLGAFAALVSYERIFRYSSYRPWRTGAAVTVFAALEFILFLFTTLVFLYYYHRHMAGIPMYSSGRNRKGEHGAAESAAAGAGAGAVAHGAENHRMHSMAGGTGPPGTQTGGYDQLGAAARGPRINGRGPRITGGISGVGGGRNGVCNGLPYPDHPPREGGYTPGPYQV